MKKIINRLELSLDMQELLKKNARLIAFFSTMLIVIVGMTLKNDPGKWWISIIAVSIFFLGIFLLLNARVFIKSIIAIMIALLEATWGYKAGTETFRDASLPSIWLFSILCCFFITLSISYIIPSGKSRWNTVAFASIIGFITSYTLIAMNVNITLSIIIGATINILSFIFFYKINRRSFYQYKNMPQTRGMDMRYEAMEQQALDNGWGARILRNKFRNKYARSMLLWNDTRAYCLIFIDMDEPFEVGGKKGDRLTYKERNINPWLLDLSLGSIPLFKTRGAPIMLVLLDAKGTNGRESKVIGVQLPDTKKKIPVGVLSAVKYVPIRAYGEMFKLIDEKFHDMIVPLSERQLKNMDKLLPEETEKN